MMIAVAPVFVTNFGGDSRQGKSTLASVATRRRAIRFLHGAQGRKARKVPSNKRNIHLGITLVAGAIDRIKADTGLNRRWLRDQATERLDA